jgi:hypothetical protein
MEQQMPVHRQALVVSSNQQNATKMKYYIILLLWSLQLFVGCKKSDVTMSLQGRTYALLSVGDGRVNGYIKGRELTEHEATDFVAEVSFYFDPHRNKSLFHDTISFTDNKRVTFNKGSIKSWFYKVKENTIRYTTDTLLGNYCSRWSACLENAFLWKQDSVGVWQNYASIPGGAPPLIKTIEHKENMLDGDNITIPLLCFRIKNHTSAISGVRENYFDKDYINRLNDNDTIAVKEYKMVFKKVN